jgi:hypothetical protein
VTLHTFFVIAMVLTATAMSALIVISPLDFVRKPRLAPIGTRVRWLKKKKSGKFESITAVVTKVIGELALVEEVYGDRRKWVRRTSIIRKP